MSKIFELPGGSSVDLSKIVKVSNVVNDYKYELEYMFVVTATGLSQPLIFGYESLAEANVARQALVSAWTEYADSH